MYKLWKVLYLTTGKGATPGIINGTAVAGGCSCTHNIGMGANGLIGTGNLVGVLPLNLFSAGEAPGVILMVPGAGSLTDRDKIKEKQL